MGFIKGNITAVTAAPLIEADNGLSRTAIIPRTVKLGQDVGQVGNPAVLLNNREIPMAGFNMLLTGAGNVIINDTTDFGPTLQVTPDLLVGESTGGRNHVYINRNAIEVRSNTGTRFSIVNLTIQDAAFPNNCALFLSDPGGLGGIYSMQVVGTTIANTGMISMYYLTGNAFLSNGPLLPDNGSQLQIQGKGTLSVNSGVAIGMNVSATTFLLLGANTTGKSGYRYSAGPVTIVLANGNKEFDGTNEFLTAGAVRYTLAKTLTATAVLNFPLTAAQTSSDLTVALTGAVAGDIVTLGLPATAAADANTCYTAFVAAANLVTVRFNNYSAGGVTPAAGSTFRVAIHKY